MASPLILKTLNEYFGHYRYITIKEHTQSRLALCKTSGVKIWAFCMENLLMASSC